MKLRDSLVTNLIGEKLDNVRHEKIDIQTNILGKYFSHKSNEFVPIDNCHRQNNFELNFQIRLIEFERMPRAISKYCLKY